MKNKKFLAAFLILIILLIAYFFYPSLIANKNIASRAEISTSYINEKYSLVQGRQIKNISDEIVIDDFPSPPVSFWGSPKLKKNEIIPINFEWKTRHKFSYLKFIFAKGGFVPADIKIQYFDNNNQSWSDVKMIDNNNSETVEIELGGIKTDQLKIFVSNPVDTEKEEIRIIETYIYETVRWPLNLLYNFYDKFLKDIIISIFLFLLFFIPGYSILNLFKLKFTQKEIFCMSFGVTFILFSLFSALELTLNISSLWLIGVVIIASIVIFLRKNYFTKLKEIDTEFIKIILLFFVFYLFVGIFYNNFRPSYGFDTLSPYIVAKIFIDKLKLISENTVTLMGGYHVSDRTFLLSFIYIPFSHILGESIRYYSLFILCVNALLIGPIFLLLERFFSRQVAIIASIFYIPNIFIFYLRFATPNKILGTYFIFLFAYFLFKNLTKLSWQNILISGVFAPFAFLSHQMSLYFIPAIIIGYIIFNSNRRKHLKYAFVVSFILLITISLWGLWSVKYDRISRTALNAFAPTISDSNEIFQKDQRQSIDFMSGYLSNLSIKSISPRFLNLLNLFVGDIKNPKISFQVFYGTILAPISLTLVGFFIISIIKFFRNNKLIIFSFIIFPISITTFLIMGYYENYGGDYISYSPTIPFFLAFAVKFILSISRLRKFFPLIYIIYLIENFFISYYTLNIFNFKVANNDILLSPFYLLMLSFILCCYIFSIYIIKDTLKVQKEIYTQAV